MFDFGFFCPTPYKGERCIEKFQRLGESGIFA